MEARRERRRPGGGRGLAAAAGLLLAVALPGAATELAGGDVVPDVPAAWDYVSMTPEQRARLRERVRVLPDAQRREFDRALMEQVRSLPDWIYEALSNERVEQECRSGRMSGPLPPPPELDGRRYALLVPHQRYHFRLRARALPPEQRQAYERRLAAELAQLPQWLQDALAEEAAREDVRYGLEPCARVRGGTPD